MAINKLKSGVETVLYMSRKIQQKIGKEEI